MQLVIDEPEACGLGQGAKTCAYLIMGHDFICGRTVDGIQEQIDARLAKGTMNAKRAPTKPFPDCRLEGV